MAGFEFVRAVTERFRARPPHAQARTRASWWVEPAVFALFTVVAFAMLLPLPLHVRTHGVDFGWDDSYINTHFMRVFQDWLLGLRPGHRALDADFFYPHALALTTNDACLGLSVMLLPLRAVTDDYGFVHDAAGLMVADASLFPTPIGVNPMETIQALATRAAAHSAGGQVDRKSVV